MVKNITILIDFISKIYYIYFKVKINERRNVLMKKHNLILLLLILLAIIVVVIKLFSNGSEVTVEIVKGSVTTEGVHIQITDNSKGLYSWGGPHYYIEVKEDEEWKEVEPIRPVVFHLLAFTLDKNHQLDLSICWFNNYGELSKGTYRIRIIANKFNTEINQSEEIAFYSNEFEIK